MARRPKREEHDNLERWLISYADFITLLFAFFVVMYSLSSLNEGKYKLFSLSLTTAFANKPQSDKMQPTSEHEVFLRSMVDRRDFKAIEQQRRKQELFQSVVKEIDRVISPLVKSGQVNVKQGDRGVEIDINASALFNVGEAALLPEGTKTMIEVAQVLQQQQQPIEVQGHTDDIPIKTQQFPSNWELSSARASSVVRLFIDHGVASARLMAVGLADNKPIVPNDTPEGRAKNRRVTVTILAPTAEAAPAPNSALQTIQ